MDPYGGHLQEPATLHRYLYAGNNPVMMVDPSGEFFSLMSLGAANSIRSTLISIQFDVGMNILGRDPNSDESIVDISTVFAATIPYIGSVLRPLAKTAKRTKIGWLRKHEGGRLGHTIENHVCKGIGFLRDRLKGILNGKKVGSIDRASTFPDLQTAEHVIMETVRQNRNDIHEWVKGGMKGGRKAFQYTGNGKVIGVGVEKGNPNILEFSDAVIVLRRNKNRKGFHIYTAHPEKFPTF